MLKRVNKKILAWLLAAAMTAAVVPGQAVQATSGGHVHDYVNGTWYADPESHYAVCAGCDSEQYGNHSDMNADGFCEECKASVSYDNDMGLYVHQHTGSNVVRKDADHHFSTCVTCGRIYNEYHWDDIENGNASNATPDGYCDACGEGLNDGNQGNNTGTLMPNQFDSFEKLKERIDEFSTEQAEVDLVYVGSDDFVISESLTIPNNIILHMNEKGIVINDDCTLQVERIYCGDLEVNGNLILGDHVQLEYPAEVSGISNIEFKEDWARVIYSVRFDSSEELKNLSKEVSEKGIVHEHVIYSFRHEDRNMNLSEVELEITDSIVIPKNSRLEFWGLKSVTVAENAELVINGDMNIGTNMTVKGKLVNNEWVSVDHEQGKLILDNEASYAGSGTLRIDAGKAEIDVQDYIVADNFDSLFRVNTDIDPEGYYHYDLLNADALMSRGEFSDFAGLKNLVSNGENRDY